MAHWFIHTTEYIIGTAVGLVVLFFAILGVMVMRPWDK